MIKEYFDDLVSGIETKILLEPESRSPRKIYALEVAKIGQRLYSGKERVAWCGVTAPFDLLYSMGVTSCFTEFVGAMLASIGVAGEFIEAAEHDGFAGEVCGYHRSVMGAAMKGHMPDPDFLIATTCPCSGGLAVMENLARDFKKDLFVLNVPQEETKEGVDYLAEQFEHLVRFVSDHTGQPLDPARLREAVVLTNEARELLEDLFKLSQHVPSPGNARLFANFGIAMPLIMGSRGGVDVARTYLDDFAQRVENGVSGVPNERFRIMWIQNRIQFKNPLMDLLEKEHGAAVISDELNAITWDPIDPDDPYTGMARRAISNPFNGRIQSRISHLQNLARAYRIDGAINPCNWGCRQGAGARGLIARGLKEIDVPVLNLEVDCVDARSFSEGQLATRIE
ncbi:MAG: 2-hydroxyacyl-CoA dehydratase, partial [Desulfobacterales bacterium]|nr:2-hydroxyacyl-CoA dehydratase [Desulfobacterales bacterium]